MENRIRSQRRLCAHYGRSLNVAVLPLSPEHPSGNEPLFWTNAGQSTSAPREAFLCAERYPFNFTSYLLYLVEYQNMHISQKTGNDGGVNNAPIIALLSTPWSSLCRARTPRYSSLAPPWSGPKSACQCNGYHRFCLLPRRQLDLRCVRLRDRLQLPNP